MKREKKSRFSILDAVILFLILAVAATAVLHDPIRRFLGDTNEEKVVYVFQINDVTDETISRPRVGETITLLQGNEAIGTVLSIEETPVTYSNENENDVTLYQLKCRAEATPEKTELGYVLGGVQLKTGANISAKTETASFKMFILEVNPITEEG